MRKLLTTILAAAALATLAGAAPPSGMPENIKLTGTGAPDFFARIATSPFIARAHVLGPVAGSNYVFKVHVDRWLKGNGPSDTTIDFGQQRPITTEGNAELLFLGPTPVRDGGADADLRAVTVPNERYEAPDAQVPLLDQAVGDVLAGAPEDRVLAELLELPPRFSEPAASRLALRANGAPEALAAADAAVLSPKTDPQARSMLVTMLGGRLPLATLGELSKTAPDERIRMSAIEALGRLAANQPAQRAQAVAAIGPSAQDANPHLQLAAGVALAEAGQPEALRPLDAILAGSDQDLRAEAVRALAELARHGNADAYDRLEKLKGDKDHEVATRAANLLSTLGPAPQPQRSPAAMFGLISLGVVVVLVLLLALRNRKRA